MAAQAESLTVSETLLQICSDVEEGIKVQEDNKLLSSIEKSKKPFRDFVYNVFSESFVD